MLAFILRRLIQAVIVMVVVALIAFMLFQYVGDPVVFLLGQDATPAQITQLRSDLGLDRPFIVQFWHFLMNAAQGEFGLSLRQGAKVSRLISERFPATFELALVAALMALAHRHPDGRVFGAAPRLVPEPGVHDGLAAGRLAADLPDRHPADPGVRRGLGWLPSFGRGETSCRSAGGARASSRPMAGTTSILPAMTLAVFQLTLIMRLVRAEMLEVLRTDYIKFARARGLPNRAIHFGHALKNTLVPVITITGLQLGSMIAFAIITETVFQWPGMGLLFIQAVTFADIPVMAAYLCLIALIFVIINLVVDLLYFAVDPRLRVGNAAGH
jgi:peptide/nickel transport system permease protein